VFIKVIIIFDVYDNTAILQVNTMDMGTKITRDSM